MINPQIAWNILKENASNALILNTQYHSHRDGVPYTIGHVTETYIEINRNGEPVKLTKNNIRKAINRLNQNDGQPLHYEDFLHTVAKETTLVLFHPQLNWTADRRHIREVNQLYPLVTSDL